MLNILYIPPWALTHTHTPTHIHVHTYTHARTHAGYMQCWLPQKPMHTNNVVMVFLTVVHTILITNSKQSIICHCNTSPRIKIIHDHRHENMNGCPYTGWTVVVMLFNLLWQHGDYTFKQSSARLLDMPSVGLFVLKNNNNNKSKTNITCHINYRMTGFADLHPSWS